MKKLTESQKEIRALRKEIQQDKKSMARNERQRQKWKERDRISNKKKAIEQRNQEIYELFTQKNAKILRLAKKYDLSKNTIKKIIDKQFAKRYYDNKLKEWEDLGKKHSQLSDELSKLYKIIRRRQDDPSAQESDFDSNLRYESDVLENEFDKVGLEMDKRKKDICKSGFWFMSKKDAQTNYEIFCEQTEEKKPLRKPKKYHYHRERKYRSYRSQKE